MLFTGIIFQLIQNVQKDPYMDEIFHVPQAQQYCKHNFSNWDPMITTLPGLYLISIVILNSVTLFNDMFGVNFTDICTTQNLRAFNLLFCAGNFILLYLLGKKLNGSDVTDNKYKNKEKYANQNLLLLNSSVLVLFPVLYFFSWFYYTDPGSTFFTLLLYAFCIHRYYKLSSLSGIIAVLFRQTNIIWVLFCFAVVIIEIVENKLPSQTRERLKNMKNSDCLNLLFKIIFNSATDLSLIKKVFFKTYCYLCVIVIFIVFVIVNGGIVVGDRSSHEASYNFPQLFYFMLVYLLFSCLNFCQPQNVYNFLRAILKNPLKVMLFTVLSVILIKYFTYEHKYLLSDNRHYTFYFWSKLFRRFYWMRYALIPTYLFSFYQFFTVTAHKGILWQLSLLLCISLCLVPQSLLEFRYYIIPYYLIRVNMKLPSSKILLAELVFFILLNAFTVYMFIFKPFYWQNNPLPQRFMW
ncbi:putative Dol-P-Glc:Glc(2)Man(9)GlcNAc(2)-PP-Dol alpha-1,2-glucosyltransferase [Bulinus truncatus]|nr:putative Dol-P-Glc:Glc(2)Man(9)GlcNAc(2)-PP-Dol alpha-1,2-glucosyltransferase [Bulinus truncatus]